MAKIAVNRRKTRLEWEAWEDESLLDLRLCDLRLKRLGPLLETSISRLYDELADRGIRFRPHFWLSDDWYTPEGVPGIAVPFYLARPRLVQLELDCMAEVEGGTLLTCLKILRHEAAHALDHAYGLRRDRERQRLFGNSTDPYPTHYAPLPYSRSHVRHLENGYAQSHPDEDFAETFAVWLDPKSQWKKRYSRWPVYPKLVYIDALMAQVASRRPLNTERHEVAEVNTIRKSLRRHYHERQRRFLPTQPHLYDHDLRRLFTASKPTTKQTNRTLAKNMTAAAFLRKIKKEASRKIAHRTGNYQYTLDRIIREMIARSRELDLHLNRNRAVTKAQFEALLTRQTQKYLHSGRDLVTL